jgi:rhodanese-related sulfurtransferase
MRRRRRDRGAKERRVPASAALLLVVAVACSGGSGGEERSATAVDRVGPDEFASRMDDPQAMVINVHVPYEGELSGTDLFIPFDAIASSSELPEDVDRPLLVYCRTGNMSADATADLVESGYTHVTDLEGGMVAWEAAGRTIETVPGRSSPDTG